MRTDSRPSPRRVSSHFDAEPRSCSQARRLVAETLGRWECGHLAEEATLLTSELVTNSVLHAHSDVEVTVSQIGAGIRVEVADADPGPLTPADSTGPLSTGGRGLHLVQALARQWGVRPRPSGKSVWFEL